MTSPQFNIPTINSPKLIKKPLNSGVLYSIDQTEQFPIITELDLGIADIEIGFARQRTSKIGEDYLALFISPEKIIYAVADGVSLGFAGDIVAKTVAITGIEGLINNSTLEEILNSNAFRESVKEQTEARIPYTIEQFKKNGFPEGIARLKYEQPSETMIQFVVITPDRKIKIYSLGDVASIIDNSTRITGKGRWSTKINKTGKISRESYNNPQSITTFTDGIEYTKNHLPAQITAENLRERLIQNSGTSGDDCTYIRLNFN